MREQEAALTDRRAAIQKNNWRCPGDYEKEFCLLVSGFCDSHAGDAMDGGHICQG